MEVLKKKTNKLLIVIIINLSLFGMANILFDIKYEQVDDFIIYNLYSGLDGTYNVHGVYIHPVICFTIGVFFRILPMINWHSIFLLSMQFLCFTLIGYTLLKKHDNGVAIVLYTLFASIFYTALLILIQYTSVAALLIATSLLLLLDGLEKKQPIKLGKKILLFVLFSLGIMIRMQSLLIILPFMAIYFVIYIIEYREKTKEKSQIVKMLQYYIGYLVITLVVTISNQLIYQTDATYREYMEYNKIRTTLHDIIYVDYEENKEIFDEIGWSQNDHFMFYTFNFGDEEIFSKENLEKILNYKIQKDGKYPFERDITKITGNFMTQLISDNTYITTIFMSVFILGLLKESKMKQNILVFGTTLMIHLVFVIINRAMLRVVIPEYIMGTALLFYHLELTKQEIKDNVKNSAIMVSIIAMICLLVGRNYNSGYQLGDYKSTQDIINYTKEHKENAYLYTVPSLQYRYLAYSVYQMPPKAAFSNLRVIGGWDMFTGNYYDFKERYQLDGNLLDLLKDNVYLIDGDVHWSGRRYDNYKANVVYAIKEHYNIDVTCEKQEEFDNLAIYKVRPIQEN
jgi:hypothetical protein